MSDQITFERVNYITKNVFRNGKSIVLALNSIPLNLVIANEQLKVGRCYISYENVFSYRKFVEERFVEVEAHVFEV